MIKLKIKIKISDTFVERFVDAIKYRKGLHVLLIFYPWYFERYRFSLFTARMTSMWQLFERLRRNCVCKKNKKCLFAALSIEMTTWALFSGTSLFTTREHDDSRLVIFTRHRFLLTVFENDEESGKCNGLNYARLQLHRILLSFAIRLIDEFTHKFLSLFTCGKLFAIFSQVWYN